LVINSVVLATSFDDWWVGRTVGPLGKVVSPFRPTLLRGAGTAPPRCGGETLVQVSEPLVQILGRGATVGSLWSSFTPLSLGRGRVAPPPVSILDWWVRESNLQVHQYL